MPKALANLRIVVRLGHWIPRSRSLMKVRSSPLFTCKSICDMFRLFLISRITCPNALSGPDKG